MADLAGRINIELKRSDGGLDATIRSSRPVATSQAFVGKTIEETTANLPAVFSVCATAQACACTSACEAALELPQSRGVVRLRRRLVDAEAVKEHLWRMLLDWPSFLGEPPQRTGMQAVMAAYAGLRAELTSGQDPFRPGSDALESDFPAVATRLDELAGLSAKYIFRAPAENWLDNMRISKDLLSWADRTDTVAARLMRELQARGWQSAGRNAVAALPRLSVAELEPLLANSEADRFVAAPIWRNDPRESSPFTRRRQQALVAALIEEHGNGLLPRFVAQLVELASVQQSLRSGAGERQVPTGTSAASTRFGVGIARVAAARGLLVHRVVLDQGRIGEYRILAPTEWNFHPRGVVAQGLSAMPSSDAATLKRLAGLFVTAVDPCVEYHVSVS